MLLFCLWCAAPAAAQGKHAWEHIIYPEVTVPGVPGHLALFVDSGSHDSVSHLRLSLHYGTSSRSGGKEKPPDDIFEPAKMEIRLRLGGGRVVSPEKGRMDRWIGLSSGLGTDWTLLFMFPWQENKLEEAWIELRLPQQTFWIELPYGFARNPSDPLADDPEHGVPSFPPAMKDLPAKDVLVPWLFVEYNLGPIQNDWRLALHVSNPFNARAEVILYHETNRLWDLHTPRTTLETRWPGGRHEAHCVGIRLTDLLRRNDDYLLGGGPGPEKGRVWGKLVVGVEDKSYDCIVPSSLFKYTHGVTDPYHKQRLPRPKPTDGDF